MSTGPESGGFTVIRRERIPFPLLSSARFGDIVATIGAGYHRVVRDGAARRTLCGNTKRIRAPSAPLRACSTMGAVGGSCLTSATPFIVRQAAVYWKLYDSTT